MWACEAPEDERVERVDMHRLQELVRLHRMGSGSHAAARMLRMSPKTERVYRTALMAAGLWDGPRRDKGSDLCQLAWHAAIRA